MKAIKIKPREKPITQKSSSKSVKRKVIHSVEASLQVVSMTKRGSCLTLEAFANKKKLGTLEIGSGSIIWYPANSKGKTKKSWTWTKFAELMEPKNGE